MERYNSLTSNYYQNCQGIILVYSNSKDKGETVSGLSMIVESAIDYSRTPDLLVFALWGSVLDERQNMPLSDLVTSFGDNCKNGKIPNALRCTVCPSTGMGIREGLTGLVRAVADIYKPRSDSILTSEIECSEENSHDTVIGPQQMEMSRPISPPWYKRLC